MNNMNSFMWAFGQVSWSNVKSIEFFVMIEEDRR